MSDDANNSTGTQRESETPPRRRHAGKSPLLTQYRRAELLKAALDGKPLRQTAIELGLSPRTASSQASHIIKHAHDDGSYLRILEERGVTDDFLAGKLRSLLDAKHTIWAQYMGTYSDSRQVEALETQRKALELAHKLRGHLRESAGPSVEIGLMQMVLQVVRDGGDFTSSGKSGADNE